MKTEIHNLIILDESGSMHDVKPQTISGCNETINTIRAAQEKFADTQDHFVSIYVFQESQKTPSRYLIKDVPVSDVSHITPEQYEPWGCTPLYDAVGETLTELKEIVKGKELAIGAVTIITDGLENASKKFSHSQVAKMIDALKELGWQFSFIGANIDVKNAASSLNIDNTMEFQQDEAGTRAMFECETTQRMKYYGRVSTAVGSRNGSKGIIGSVKDLIDDLKEAATNYFEGDDNSNT